MKTVCTSRPDCPCDFCVRVRAEIGEGRTAKDEERIAAFCWLRDGEMDAEARAAGTFGTYPGELVEVA